MKRGAWCLVACLSLAPWSPAQEEPSTRADEPGVQPLDLRVIESLSGGEVRVDHGASDGLALGDLVLFYDTTRGTFGGTITELEARTAVVELERDETSVAVGAQGRVYVPRARLKRLRTQTKPEADTTIAPWLEAEDDDGWTPDQPLLAGLAPVRPRDRSLRYGGRTMTSFLGTATDTNRSDLFLRTGADVWIDNPFGRGGTLNVDVEGNYRNTNEPFGIDESRARLRVDRLSYAWGGTRFDGERYQVGRFLQSGMPEFGVLDGVEYSQRLDNGDRFGASVGFMPEPDLDHATGDDFQFAAWYHWLFDDSDRFALETGIQKTLHDGDSDRDLIVSRFRYLPPEGWRTNATVWIDRYGGSDPVRGAGLGLTQAIVSVSKNEGLSHGVSWTYSHRELPELDRNEIRPVLAEELADDRRDRLAFDGWKRLDRSRVAHGHASVWFDEDDSGGDVDGGIEWRNLGIPGLRLDVTGFVGRSAYGYDLGAEATAIWNGDYGRFELGYDVTRREQIGFENDADHLFLHRGTLRHHWTYGSGWNLSSWMMGRVAEDELSGSVGVTLTRSF